MAIRLRTVSGTRVALCANEFSEIEGDLYLDDADHEALAAKYAHDLHGHTIGAVYKDAWNVMDSQERNPDDWCPEIHRARWDRIRHLL